MQTSPPKLLPPPTQWGEGWGGGAAGRRFASHGWGPVALVEPPPTPNPPHRKRGEGNSAARMWPLDLYLCSVSAAGETAALIPFSLTRKACRSIRTRSKPERSVREPPPSP